MAFLPRLDKEKQYKVKAFSLVELLISVSIIALMAMISISAYPKFSAQLKASTESYKLLAWLKETQTYGVSAFTQPSGRQVYGIEFDKNANTIKRVIAPLSTLVTDNFGTGSKFTNGGFLTAKKDFDGENPEFVLDQQFKIIGICDNEDCDPVTSTYDKAYAVYRRPNPEARIFVEEGSVRSPSPAENDDRGSKSKAVIFIASINQSEIKKKIIILRTGQMYVKEW